MRVTNEMNPVEIAKEIYHNAELHQSCLITGFVRFEDDVEPRGALVLKELQTLYEIDQMYKGADGRHRRRRKLLPNSVGGELAHKIFVWRKVVSEGSPRYTIWRKQ